MKLRAAPHPTSTIEPLTHPFATIASIRTCRGNAGAAAAAAAKGGGSAEKKKKKKP